MNSARQNEHPQVKVTGDGSHTLYVPLIDEHYHSHFGALTESKHIFIEAGFNHYTSENVSLLEIGFGTGLNALLTAQAAEKQHRKVSYTSLEKYPLPAEIVSILNHPEAAGLADKTLFDAIHNASWGSNVTITPWFMLHKIEMDLTKDPVKGMYDLIYFDAFGPDKQPEMWTNEVLMKIAQVTHQGSVFVTYSAKGSLKRILKDLGFEVNHLPGPPGKRVITCAIKK